VASDDLGDARSQQACGNPGVGPFGSSTIVRYWVIAARSAAPRSVTLSTALVEHEQAQSGHSSLVASTSTRSVSSLIVDSVLRSTGTRGCADHWRVDPNLLHASSCFITGGLQPQRLRERACRHHRLRALESPARAPDGPESATRQLLTLAPTEYAAFGSTYGGRGNSLSRRPLTERTPPSSMTRPLRPRAARRAAR
jgi:hypothetical protein